MLNGLLACGSTLRLKKVLPVVRSLDLYVTPLATVWQVISCRVNSRAQGRYYRCDVNGTVKLRKKPKKRKEDKLNWVHSSHSLFFPTVVVIS